MTNESDESAVEEKPARRPQGFACLSAEQRAAISSAGGKAAHARGRAHQFTSEEAREAGRKGGRGEPARATGAAVREHLIKLGLVRPGPWYTLPAGAPWNDPTGRDGRGPT